MSTANRLDRQQERIERLERENAVLTERLAELERHFELGANYRSPDVSTEEED